MTKLSIQAKLQSNWWQEAEANHLLDSTCFCSKAACLDAAAAVHES